ncbi:hypothetical protein RHOSPDRAFT_15885, partial [Rhodotorula sp. JG-1b]
GPDASNTLSLRLSTDNGTDLELHFFGSVLHMRGDKVTPQPLVSSAGDILLWNGEIFDGVEVGEHENDSIKLMERIQQFGPERFLEAIGPVEGPYAFVYFQAAQKRLWYGRDPLGRRSLLSCDADGPSQAPLVGHPPRTFRYDIDVLTEQVFPFDRINPALPSLGDTVPMTRKFPPDPVIGQRILEVMRIFISELEGAIRARVATVPPVPAPPAARVAVLFSGGLDCTVIAAILDRVLPRDEAIDLITVAFENPRSLKAREQTLQHPPKGPSRHLENTAQPLGPYDVPDRLTARDAWRELRELAPNRRWNLVEVDVPYHEVLDHRQHVIDLMKPQNTAMDLSIALAFYFAARGQGHLAAVASDDEPEAKPYTSHARVLLSGLGADELLGGYARHRRAFNQPLGRAEDNAQSEQPPSFVFPGQAPGSAANENWQALVDELQMDLDRLPTRNLGRDDRIIATHGKEARYPFLAGHVVEFLARQPVWYKADMRFVEGVGDKMLLRSVARELGLHKAARRKKRAIHFGARTAKMNLGDGGAKGTDLL